MRPIVGLTTALERASWGPWDQDADVLPRMYSEAVQAAGGIAVLLPPDSAAQGNARPWLDRLDALIITGGADIDPSFYGAKRHPATGRTVPIRDAFEIALASGALEVGLPLLGVCRGMQIMNVARGGTLTQHLPETVGHDSHRRSPGSFVNSEHDVRLAEGSLVRHIAGEAIHSTKSHHHQGIDVVGDGFDVTGWATADDLPETIEDRAHTFALGVQWHPEADEASNVIAALVSRAESRCNR